MSWDRVQATVEGYGIDVVGKMSPIVVVGSDVGKSEIVQAAFELEQ